MASFFVSSIIRVIFITFAAFKCVAGYITDSDHQECSSAFSLKLRVQSCLILKLASLTPLERARAEPVVLPMDNVTVYEGENATLLCKALSDSMPHFQWLRWRSSHSNGTTNSKIEHPHYEVIRQNLQDLNDLVLSQSNNRYDFHGQKLTLVNVTKKDRGKYTCIVGNAVGYGVQEAYIIVYRQKGK